MTDRARSEGHRILVCAPYGQDADILVGLLSQRGYESLVCITLGDVAGRLDDQVGLVLLTEEALAFLDHLREALQSQPAWSDIPFVVLAGRQTGIHGAAHALRGRLNRVTSNAVVLERPLGATSLLSAVASALHARSRQFDLRDQLEELDAHNDRLTSLLQNLPVGVAFVNPDGTTLLSNPEFRRFRPDDEVPYAPAIVAEAAADGTSSIDSRQVLHEAVASALNGRPLESKEVLLDLPDQDARWTRVSSIALKPTTGDVRGAIAVVIDIDSEKRAQLLLTDAAAQLDDQVRARTSELERALTRLREETGERERTEALLRQSQKMEAVGQLTGGIAHDFNNMLTGIMGAIDLMRRRLASGRTEGIERYMTAATSSAVRAAALTQRLLAFARRQSLDARPVEINRLIRDMSELIERALAEHIDLRLALPDDLATGVVDPNQLESAILNLAINARDAMPSGGSLTITTRNVDVDATAAVAEADLSPGRYVAVTVSDTGVGMSREVLDKAFDPFFTTKPIGQGTRLGLSMVYGFARQSGGQVRIDSQVNQGTSVTLYLPSTNGLPTIDAQEPTVAVRGDGERVMIVEDDASVRLLVKEVLEELKYEAIEYADPLLALPYLQSSERVDLLISDVGLPQMNGRELAETARRSRPELPILFITGYAENAAIRAEFLGANMAMVTKPFAMDALAARISEMLHQPPNPPPAA